MGERGKIEGLEFARFAFAFAVLVYHYLWYGPVAGELPTPPGPSWLIFGRFAVEAFFVISGYVIARSSIGRSATQFAIARTARLWPALALCALVTFLVTGGAALPLAKALLFVPMILGGGQVDPSYWSIVVEMRFYLAVFVLLVAFRRLPRLDWLCATWLLASVCALLVPALAPWTLSPYSAFFIFGLLLYSRDAGSGAAKWLMIPTALLASIQTWVDFAHIDLMDGERSPLWVGAAITVVVFATTFAMRCSLPRWLTPLALTLGAMTYPLYLIHQLAGYALIKALTPIVGWEPAVIATTAAALLLAYAVCKWVEPPARGLLTRALKAASSYTGVRLAALRRSPTPRPARPQ